MERRALALALPLAASLTVASPVGSATRPPLQAPEQPAGRALEVREHALSNGFTILVIEDHRSPRVAANLWIRVGSMQEPVGMHGMTHFLEHVIHQGTTTVGAPDLASEFPILERIHETEAELIAVRNRERNRLRERGVFIDELAWKETPEMDSLRRQLYKLEDEDSQYRELWASYKAYMERGGYSRHTDPVPASTEQEYMEIGMALPRESLELFFRIEADRMANAVLRGWEAQRFTVLEQVLNGHSQPQSRFNEAIDGATGAAHPVYQPDGGHLRDFGNFTRAAHLEIYDRYFVPNNATLVLVGDVTMADVVPLAERYFGALPRGAEPPADLDLEAEPVPGGSIRLDWTEPLSPQVHVRHRIPGVGHPDRPAFDVIAALLAGPHGLAARRLGEQGAAAAVTTDFRVIHTNRFGSTAAFNLVARAQSDAELAAVERALLAAIDDLRSGRIEPAALARAQKRLRLEWAEVMNSPQELAFTVGHYQTMDGWRALPELIAARDRATVEDVQRVARTYFVPSNRVIAVARAEPPAGSGPSWLDLLGTERGAEQGGAR